MNLSVYVFQLVVQVDQTNQEPTGASNLRDTQAMEDSMSCTEFRLSPVIPNSIASANAGTRVKSTANNRLIQLCLLP
jgi:hypothetical protein